VGEDADAEPCPPTYRLIRRDLVWRGRQGGWRRRRWGCERGLARGVVCAKGGEVGRQDRRVAEHAEPMVRGSRAGPTEVDLRGLSVRQDVDERVGARCEREEVISQADKGGLGPRARALSNRPDNAVTASLATMRRVADDSFEAQRLDSYTKGSHAVHGTPSYILRIRFLKRSMTTSSVAVSFLLPPPPPPPPFLGSTGGRPAAARWALTSASESDWMWCVGR